MSQKMVEQAFGACTDDGTLLKLKGQVTEVNKALLSVARLLNVGNRENGSRWGRITEIIFLGCGSIKLDQPFLEAGPSWTRRPQTLEKKHVELRLLQDWAEHEKEYDSHEEGQEEPKSHGTGGSDVEEPCPEDREGRSSGSNGLGHHGGAAAGANENPEVMVRTKQDK